MNNKGKLVIFFGECLSCSHKATKCWPPPHCQLASHPPSSRLTGKSWIHVAWKPPGECVWSCGHDAIASQINDDKHHMYSLTPDRIKKNRHIQIFKLQNNPSNDSLVQCKALNRFRCSLKWLICNQTSLTRAIWGVLLNNCLLVTAAHESTGNCVNLWIKINKFSLTSSSLEQAPWSQASI